MTRWLAAMLTVVFLLALSHQRAEAWNATGHMTIAKLAWEQLDAGQRETAYRLLLQHPHVKEFFDKQPRPKGGVGIRCGKESKGLQADDNQFVNLQTPIERAGEAK